MQVGGGKNQLIIKLQLHAEREYIKEETGSLAREKCMSVMIIHKKSNHT